MVYMKYLIVYKIFCLLSKAYAVIFGLEKVVLNLSVGCVKDFRNNKKCLK